MPEENDAPTEPTLPDGVSPDEMFARAMQTVRMTQSGAHGWQPQEIEEVARLFPGYEVLALLGRGGMGAVYQARQNALDRLVAIKLLPLEISIDQTFADRFRREARAMAKLNHPHIIAVYDFGQTAEGHLFIVMEYVEGANLSDIIHQVGLDPDQALSVVEQVCAALGYAHGKGVVHRDIKPANVMIDTESHVKVADFGLARLIDQGGTTDFGHTMTGTVMGTPDYMAPEQMHGMNVDHRADIYSLGVMIYEMLCREAPKGAFELPSARTGCDPRIDAIVLKAMQQAPDRRYQTTQEMKTDVSAARFAAPVPAPPPVVAPPKPLPKPHALAKPARPLAPLPPPAAKSRVLLYAGIVSLVVAILGGVIYFAKAKPKLETEQVPRSSAQFPALATATKAAPFVNTLGMKFVPVAGTKVLFGVWDTRVQDYAAYARVNTVDGAWSGQLRDGVPAGQDPEHPVVGVSWADAEAFCRWLTNNERAGGKLPMGAKYRLPTDEEWSHAVGLGLEQGATPAEKEGRNGVDSPWGTGYPPTAKVGNYADTAFHAKFPLNENGVGGWARNEWMKGYTDGYATTSPVGSFPANAFGLYDMGGNVWQWCEDWYDSSQKDRVVRGASWSYYDRSTLLSAARNHSQPTFRRYDYGFRCVLEPAPAALSPAAALEPGAIKLWDAPEKVPKDHWDKDALVFNHNSLQDSSTKGTNGIIRASIRMNTDAIDPKISLRYQGPTVGLVKGYFLAVHSQARKIKLIVCFDGKFDTLKEWPLPRAYGTDEWARVELRALGDELTASLDGKVLGTIHDTSVSGPGVVSLYGTTNAYFRDIVYIPLDPPAATPIGYPQPREWKDRTDKIRSYGLETGELVADGEWLTLAPGKERHFTNALSSKPTSDVAIRVVFANKVNAALRQSDDGNYIASIFSESPRIYLYRKGENNIVLKGNIDLGSGYVAAAEHEMVFAAQGDTLTLWMDGREVATVRDGTSRTGGMQISFEGNSRIKKVETGELESTGTSPPAAPAVPK